jgi:hypothetical protein
MMEIPSSSDQGLKPFTPDVFVEMSWADKAKILTTYDHELGYAPDRYTDVCESLARVRGATVGVPAAEGFKLLRSVFRTE